MSELIKERGAEIVIGDPGRYTATPPYINQRGLLWQGMRDAARWYETGKLKPIVTVVPFDARAVQEAMDGMVHSKTNVGKIVVKVSQESEYSADDTASLLTLKKERG